MSKRLEQLLKKESQLKAQIQLAQAAERTKERKKETRRKFLIGTAILSQVESGDFAEEQLVIIMDAFLTRPNERALFGLAALETPPPSQAPKVSSVIAEQKKPVTTQQPTTKAKTTSVKKAPAKKRRTTKKAAQKSQ